MIGFDARRPEEVVQVNFNGSDATVPGADGTGGSGGVGTRSDARRLPTLVRSIAADLSLLARQQTELAKQELGEMAGTKAKGAGMLAAAAVLGLFVLGFLGLAGAAALDLVMSRWAALLIVGAVYLVIAAVLGLAGRGALRAKATPVRTKRTVKEDVEWAKQQLRR